jgi:hypothetical protein
MTIDYEQHRKFRAEMGAYVQLSNSQRKLLSRAGGRTADAPMIPFAPRQTPLTDTAAAESTNRRRVTVITNPPLAEPVYGESPPIARRNAATIAGCGRRIGGMSW